MSDIESSALADIFFTSAKPLSANTLRMADEASEIEGWTRVTVRMPVEMREALEAFYDQAPRDTERGKDSPESRTFRWLLKRGVAGLKKAEPPGLSREEANLRRAASRAFIALREKDENAADVWVALGLLSVNDRKIMGLLLGLAQFVEGVRLAPTQGRAASMKPGRTQVKKKRARPGT